MAAGVSRTRDRNVFLPVLPFSLELFVAVSWQRGPGELPQEEEKGGQIPEMIYQLTVM